MKVWLIIIIIGFCNANQWTHISRNTFLNLENSNDMVELGKATIQEKFNLSGEYRLRNIDNFRTLDDQIHLQLHYVNDDEWRHFTVIMQTVPALDVLICEEEQPLQSMSIYKQAPGLQQEIKIEEDVLKQILNPYSKFNPYNNE